MEMPDALGRVEAELRRASRRGGRAAMARWATACPMFEGSGGSPVEVSAWVWRLDAGHADVALRALVDLAQAGDELATLTVVACLRPGLCSLVKSLRVGIDEVVSEASMVVLTFSPTRRRRIAAGLLLDVRHRFWELQKKVAREVPVGETVAREAAYGSPGELDPTGTPPERLALVVFGAWRAGVLDRASAALILETRLYGETVVAAAARRGISAKAAYERRRRAEARLSRSMTSSSRHGRHEGHRPQRRSGHGALTPRATYSAMSCQIARPRRGPTDGEPAVSDLSGRRP